MTSAQREWQSEMAAISLCQRQEPTGSWLLPYSLIYKLHLADYRYSGIVELYPSIRFGL